MTTIEKFDPEKGQFGMKDGVQTCPHCGKPLYSRHDIRQHLTLKVCQGGMGELDGDDIRPRPHGGMIEETRPEDCAEDAGYPGNILDRYKRP